MKLPDVLKLAPVVPVLIIEDVDKAVPLARALVKGGLKALEVTLRTPVALECIRRIAGEVEDGVAGAGTIINPAMREEAHRAGAKFGVSPGLIGNEDFDDGPLPLLPGIATATELMAGLEAGYSYFKLFPANIVGGVGALKAFASPFPQATFCPTGGVSLENAPDYLALPNVICVGGSWVAPADAVRDGDWDRITALAKQAAALGK
ncbi:MAG TPA: bifunctional 4-hydroxy-2-oxoglutarate aldolase/2-dehydro-3-deoxy-phosphogluconate aldolase [Phenylobacterium sp.]|nr:bifunctional 4-hydroxy-2-oxoglutarate aldolase/2-dehydro-3-deoxy-phosphogluconate aldolase [Phenylobacterium sp.]HQN49638.1 bifunctional 4-hydroxy-2-oxoglutarate aldolase/2-dehydro-3-deoxy-phosphogluconate aldolase [Phenylobacterium sp.]HQP19288.1 bifunctional 4-hydroxy-2-oxoglutarate aldolase/2-dehydro-3-deoxy-phosphogluconate aldolase [Phenylobacterium sp.]